MMRWFIIKLLIWIATTCTDAKRDFTIEVHDYRFNLSSPSFVKTLNYNLHLQRYITVEFALNRSVSQIELKFKFDMIKKDNKRVNVLSINIDGCKGLKSAYTLPFIATITKELFRRSNLPKMCPIQPNKLYFLKNFTFNEEDYPKVTPAMSWQARTEFYFQTQYQGKLLLTGQIRRL